MAIQAFLISCTAALALLFAADPAAAQSSQTIRGRVTDRQTMQPLPGATVLVADSDPLIGTTTNPEGNFVLERVPLGRQIVRVQFIGFEPFESEPIVVTSAKEPFVEVVLTEEVMVMGAVEVRASRTPAAPVNSLSLVSARSFSVEETERIPAAVNDPGRMALAFPGVRQGRDDTENDIIIRGNSSFGVLWRLNDLDVPNPNHFARPGSAGGGITVFSAQLLNRSDFSSGAMPAEYGNALSGAFDMRFRSGNMERAERRFKAGLLGMDASAEGPLREGRSSYLVNYRYSTIDLLSKAGFSLLGERVTNVFQDLAFHLRFEQPGGNTLWSVFGMGGTSEEHTEPVANPADRDPSDQDEFEDQILGSRIGVGGVSVTHLLSTRTFLTGVVGATAGRIYRTTDTLDVLNRKGRVQDADYLDQRLQAALQLHVKASSTLYAETGLRATLIGYDFAKKTAAYVSSDDVTRDAHVGDVSGDGSTGLLQAFAQASWRPAASWTINGGLHAMHLPLNGTGALDPRLAARYETPRGSQLSLAVGLHSQFHYLPTYFFYEDGREPNHDLPPVRSLQAVLGYRVSPRSGSVVHAEGYLQKLTRVPVTPGRDDFYWVLNSQSEFPDFAVVSEGEGWNYGLDLGWERDLPEQMYLVLNGSVFDGRYRLPEGATYPTRFATGYAYSLTAGKEWVFAAGHTFRAGFKVLGGGGARYTPLDRIASAAAGHYVPVVGEAWSATTAPYFRIDAGLAWRRSFSATALLVTLDIQNVTDRANVSSVGYDPIRNELFDKDHPGGFTPVLAVQIDF